MDIYTLRGFAEPLSAISHLVGAAVFAGLSWPMIKSVSSSRIHTVCIAIFAFFSVLLLTASGAYHMVHPLRKAKAVLLQVDLCAIFLLIAASFTAVHGVLFQGLKRWGMLAIIWSLAITGIIVRLFFFEGIPNQLGYAMFLFMGWLGTLSAYWIWRSYGWLHVTPLAIGGVLYTIGAISNSLEWPTVIPKVWGPHETHHFTVLAGLSFHWWAIAGFAKIPHANQR